MTDTDPNAELLEAAEMLAAIGAHKREPVAELQRRRATYARLARTAEQILSCTTCGSLDRRTCGCSPWRTTD